MQCLTFLHSDDFVPSSWKIAVLAPRPVPPGESSFQSLYLLLPLPLGALSGCWTWKLSSLLPLVLHKPEVSL